MKLVRYGNPGKEKPGLIDAEGRLWTSAADGVHCYDSDGTLIGKVLIPELVSNVCFGGSKRNRLFMTGSQSLYAVFVETRGGTPEEIGKRQTLAVAATWAVEGQHGGCGAIRSTAGKAAFDEGVVDRLQRRDVAGNRFALVVNVGHGVGGGVLHGDNRNRRRLCGHGRDRHPARADRGA